MKLTEARSVAQRLMQEGAIDFLDMSLWDVFKEPEEEDFRGRSLLSYFTELERGPARLGAAGKMMSGTDVAQCLASGVDFAIIGRGAVLHHDFPMKVAADPGFHAIRTPVSVDYLRNEGLGPALVDYMRRWDRFVA